MLYYSCLREAMFRCGVKRIAGVAQWLECLPVTQDAAGSSPVIRAISALLLF